MARITCVGILVADLIGRPIDRLPEKGKLMLVPEMEKRGIPKAFGTVIVAVSAIITPLIPPGIAMIIY
ncbi:MAG: hypothetical protein N2Z84_00520, partial [Atribacterota bacterium]|nr:hypothetical protein [Atribacterota bacterium]